MTTSGIEIGDWVRDRHGLPFYGRVIGEGTLTTKKWPAWKLDMGGGRVTAALKDSMVLWHKGERNPSGRRRDISDREYSAVARRVASERNSTWMPGFYSASRRVSEALGITDEGLAHDLAIRVSLKAGRRALVSPASTYHDLVEMVRRDTRELAAAHRNPVERRDDGYYAALPRQARFQPEWTLGPFRRESDARGVAGLVRGASTEIVEGGKGHSYVVISGGLRLSGTPSIGPYRSSQQAAIALSYLTRGIIKPREKAEQESQRTERPQQGPGPSGVESESEAVSALRRLGMTATEARGLVGAAVESGAKGTEDILRAAFQEQARGGAVRANPAMIVRMRRKGKEIVASIVDLPLARRILTAAGFQRAKAGHVLSGPKDFKVANPLWEDVLASGATGLGIGTGIGVGSMVAGQWLNRGRKKNPHMTVAGGATGSLRQAVLPKYLGRYQATMMDNPKGRKRRNPPSQVGTSDAQTQTTYARIGGGPASLNPRLSPVASRLLADLPFSADFEPTSKREAKALGELIGAGLLKSGRRPGTLALRKKPLSNPSGSPFPVHQSDAQTQAAYASLARRNVVGTGEVVKLPSALQAQAGGETGIVKDVVSEKVGLFGRRTRVEVELPSGAKVLLRPSRARPLNPTTAGVVDMSFEARHAAAGTAPSTYWNPKGKRAKKTGGGRR